MKNPSSSKTVRQPARRTKKPLDINTLPMRARIHALMMKAAESLPVTDGQAWDKNYVAYCAQQAAHHEKQMKTEIKIQQKRII